MEDNFATLLKNLLVKILAKVTKTFYASILPINNLFILEHILPTRLCVINSTKDFICCILPRPYLSPIYIAQLMKSYLI